MMKNLAKQIEVVSNVAIIAVAVLLGVVLVKSYLFSGKPDSYRGIAAGTKIEVRDVDWAKSNHTVVLALQKGCHFCTESAPFYQRLVSQASQRGTRIIAILPNEIEASREYLSALNVRISEIRQMPLNALKVGGTPTVILVDDKGVVVRSWVGKLPPNDEAEVLSML